MPYNFSKGRSFSSDRYSRSGSGGYHARPKRGPKKDYINPSRFVKNARIVESELYVPIHSFDDFQIDPLIKANLTTKGFTSPTPIQDQAIPEGLAGKDIVGIANTGTGKTVAFAVPVLQRLINSQNDRALIMAPTRELAQQIEDECRMIAKDSGLMGAILIGGMPMMPQLRDLRANPRIVIGTPGRIKDHMERKTIDLSQFNIVVLDEVDRMLDMGFIADMKEILGALMSPRQSFFFSATMDPKVRVLTERFVHDPVTISVTNGESSDNVEQNVVIYSS
jgi:superfamily II DNA/RNA helicase